MWVCLYGEKGDLKSKCGCLGGTRWGVGKLFNKVLHDETLTMYTYIYGCVCVCKRSIEWKKESLLEGREDERIEREKEV